MMKKIIFSFVCGLAFIIPSVIAAVSSFSDVKSNDWFHGYVMKIKDWGVVSGNDDGTFAPSRNINRAEFAKMLSLYDERVDQKIVNASLGGSSDSGATEGTVMYLEKFNAESNKCPSGWSEADYGQNWQDEGSLKSFVRTCYTDNACLVMHLEKFNEEPNACPSTWKQADYGIKWKESGYVKYGRTCYKCY